MRSAQAGFGPLLPAGFDWSAFTLDGQRLAAAIAAEEVHVAVAESDGVRMGYGTVGPARDDDLDCGEIWSLFVEPEARGTGVADQLMGAGLEWLTARGYGTVMVWSFTANGRAAAFYRRHRFRPDGELTTLEVFAGLEAERLVAPLS